MDKFLVEVRTEGFYFVEVEAETPEEAADRAAASDALVTDSEFEVKHDGVNYQVGNVYRIELTDEEE